MRDGLNELHGHDNERGDNNDDDDASALQDGHVRGLMAGYALASLDPNEMNVVATHISGCATCRAELEEYRVTADLLAFAAPVHQVPLRARVGLLAKMDEIGTANQEQMIARHSEDQDASPSLPMNDVQRAWLPNVTLPTRQWSRARVAAFSAVPLLLVLALVIAMGDRISDQQDEITTIKGEQAETDRRVADIEQNDPNAVQEVIPSSAARGAQGKLIIDRDTESGLLLVVNLPQPGDDEHYIVWLDFADSEEFARAGSLTVEPDGRAKLILEPSGSIELYDAVLITAETDADVTAPTGPELMSAGIMPSE